MKRKIVSKAEMLGLTEVLVKQCPAPQAELEPMLTRHFPSECQLHFSGRFLIMNSVAHKLRIGVELGVRAQCVVKASDVLVYLTLMLLLWLDQLIAQPQLQHRYP